MHNGIELTANQERYDDEY